MCEGGLRLCLSWRDARSGRADRPKPGAQRCVLVRRRGLSVEHGARARVVSERLAEVGRAWADLRANSAGIGPNSGRIRGPDLTRRGCEVEPLVDPQVWLRPTSKLNWSNSPTNFSTLERSGRCRPMLVCFRPFWAKFGPSSARFGAISTEPDEIWPVVGKRRRISSGNFCRMSIWGVARQRGNLASKWALGALIWTKLGVPSLARPIRSGLSNDLHARLRVAPGAHES